MVLVPDINETDNDNVNVKVSERVLVVEDDEEIHNYVAHEVCRPHWQGSYVRQQQKALTSMTSSNPTS